MMAARTSQGKNVENKKLVTQNGYSDYVSVWTLVALAIGTLSGWIYYEMIFGPALYIPIKNGIYIGGWKAFAVYIAISVGVYWFAEVVNVKPEKTMVQWGIMFGSFVCCAFFRVGVYKWTFRILLFLISGYVLYTVYKIGEKLKRIPKRLMKLKKNEIYRWAERMLIKNVSTGLFQTLGIVYGAMAVCTGLSFLNLSPVQEYNLTEMKDLSISDCNNTDDTWEGRMGVSIYRDNIDVIQSFSDDKWKKTTTEEKVGLLNALCLIECTHLGIDPPSVYIYRRETDSAVAGFYRDRDRSIWIGDDQLQDPLTVMTDLLHEVRHCYQHVLMTKINIDDMPEDLKQLEIYRDIRIMKEENKNYLSAEKDGCSYRDYSRQLLEQDCRDHARSASEFYYDLANAEDPDEVLLRGRIR